MFPPVVFRFVFCACLFLFCFAINVTHIHAFFPRHRNPPNKNDASTSRCPRVPIEVVCAPSTQTPPINHRIRIRLPHIVLYSKAACGFHIVSFSFVRGPQFLIVFGVSVILYVCIWTYRGYTHTYLYTYIGSSIRFVIPAMHQREAACLIVPVRVRIRTPSRNTHKLETAITRRICFYLCRVVFVFVFFVLDRLIGFCA